MANEKLRPFLARGIGAVLLLRVIGPHFSVDRMRLCKFLAALVAKSFSTDEEIHQVNASCRAAFLFQRKIGRGAKL